MLSFRDIGTQSYRQYISTRLIQSANYTNTPLRHQKLLIMASTKNSKKRMTPKEQEAKQVIKCLRCRLQWCNENRMSFDTSEEQYSILPRALPNEDGCPHKFNKSSWTEKLQQRYELAEAKVITNSLPWVPQAIIIDAMFLTNTKPLRRTSTITEYGKLLFNQYIYCPTTKQEHLKCM